MNGRQTFRRNFQFFKRKRVRQKTFLDVTQKGGVHRGTGNKYKSKRNRKGGGEAGVNKLVA